MNNKLKFCKILVRKDIEDTIETYRIDSIELCYEHNEGIEVITGDLAGSVIPSIKNISEKSSIYGWTEDISNIKRYFPSNNIYDLKDFLEENLLDKYYEFDRERMSLKPYEEEIFIDDIEEEKDKQELDSFSNLAPLSSIKPSQKSIQQIEKEIKSNIVGQDEAIKKVLLTVYGNQKLFSSSLSPEKKNQLKNNILIFGSTGTGKTEIVRQLAKQFNLPISIEDATRYTVAGYVGANIDDMIKNLIKKAGNDVVKAQKGILVIDEIDKKRKRDNNTIGVETEEVQYSLLKLIEGTTFNICLGQGNTVSFDTSFLTIIFCGAFTELLQNPQENHHQLGFNSVCQSTNKKEQIEPDDFIKYGIIPELIGRMSSIVRTNDLDVNSIKNIITESSISPLRLKQQLFEAYGVKLSYDDAFVSRVAQEVVNLKTGARGIKLIIDKYLDNCLFEVLCGDLKEIRIVDDQIIKVNQENKNLAKIKKI